MGRSFFPTYSLNRFGVRDTDQQATLGAVRRFDNEPNPRAAMTPTGPMLGAINPTIVNGSQMIRVPISRGGPIFYTGPPPGPARTWIPPAGSGTPPPGPPGAWIMGTSGWMLSPGWQRNPDGTIVAVGDAFQIPPPSPPISSSGGGGAVVAPPVQPPASALPVSQQATPTPTVTVPPASPTSVLLISSGGGTQTPSTPTVVAPAANTSLVSNIAAWLGGTTSIFNYNVPNALIAGVVVLGFAWLSSSGKKR